MERESSGFAGLHGRCRALSASRSRGKGGDVRGSLGLLVRSALRLQIGVLRHRLLCRDLELEAAIVVGLHSGRNVKISECYLLRPLIENVHGLAHDGVVAYFLLTSIAENEDTWLVGLGVTSDRLLLWR